MDGTGSTNSGIVAGSGIIIVSRTEEVDGLEICGIDDCTSIHCVSNSDVDEHAADEFSAIFIGFSFGVDFFFLEKIFLS